MQDCNSLQEKLDKAASAQRRLGASPSEYLFRAGDRRFLYLFDTMGARLPLLAYPCVVAPCWLVTSVLTLGSPS